MKRPWAAKTRCHPLSPWSLGPCGQKGDALTLRGSRTRQWGTTCVTDFVEPSWEILLEHLFTSSRKKSQGSFLKYVRRKGTLQKKKNLHFVVVVQALSRVWLSATPWIVTLQASLSLTISWSLPKFMSTESMMLSDQPSYPLPPSSPFALSRSQHQGIFQRVGCLHQPKYWRVSFSISPSSDV